MSTSPFGNLFDKVKSSAKQAAGQMNLAGKIAGLKVERSTQKAERERLLKEIGLRTFSIYSKTQNLDSATLQEEIINELQHIERIDRRLEEIEEEIKILQKDFAGKDGKSDLDDSDCDAEDDSDSDDESKKD